MPAPEGFEAYPFGQDAPGVRWFSVTPSDAEPLAARPRCLYVGGTWSGTLPIIPKCEAAIRPLPLYQSQCTLTSGGTFTGGELYDLMHVKTAGASGQSSTVGDEMSDTLGIPKDSVGIYKFTNPGNASATCIFTMWWEEVVP